MLARAFRTVFLPVNLAVVYNQEKNMILDMLIASSLYLIMNEWIVFDCVSNTYYSHADQRVEDTIQMDNAESQHNH